MLRILMNMLSTELRRPLRALEGHGVPRSRKKLWLLYGVPETPLLALITPWSIHWQACYAQYWKARRQKPDPKADLAMPDP
jgi:hypothetical protein